MTSPSPTAAKEETKDLVSLPNELVREISDRLEDKKDVLDLRPVNERLDVIGLQALQKRMVVLYLEPSRASVDCFPKVCTKSQLARLEGISRRD